MSPSCIFSGSYSSSSSSVTTHR